MSGATRRVLEAMERLVYMGESSKNAPTKCFTSNKVKECGM